MRNKPSVILLCLLLANPAMAWRWPFVNGTLSDNMVIQRDKPAPIWGVCDPNKDVTVSVTGLKKVPSGAVTQAVVTADAKGNWEVKVGPFPAGGPCDITIVGFKEGRGTNVSYTLKNVLIGDVWLCSGQSNMKFILENDGRAAEMIPKALNPGLRFATIPERAELLPLAETTTDWQPCLPDTARGFSAVAYYFGNYLQTNISVPVGLIHSSWGGTRIQAWMSIDSLRKNIPESTADLDRTERLRTEIEKGRTVDQVVDAWYRQNDEGSRDDCKWSKPALDTSDWKKVTLPNTFAGMGYPGFHDILWLRKEVTIPEAWVGKEVHLDLDRITWADAVFFNGHCIGSSESVWPFRNYVVPAKELVAGKAVIAVRICGNGETGDSAGFFNKDPAALKIEALGVTETIPLSGEWVSKIGSKIMVGELPHRPDNNTVGANYNGMIAPLTKLPIKGVIWYQGEWNASEGRLYNRLLPVMIRDWRKQFHSGNFPFLIVQLAANETVQPVEPKEEENGWAAVREAQWRVANLYTNCGLATAVDTHGLHPTNKFVLGERLARTALARVYRKKVDYVGPTFDFMKKNGATIEVTFKNVAGGQLVVQGELKAFSIAGADNKFVWAKAQMQGKNTVVVSADAVPDPVKVRYGWDTTPECTLYDGAGLPALPFRSDMPTDLPGMP